ncbi:enoyl-CoA hydratase/isomerase family protein [Desulfogranum mediterraneum]|uniref:enoyl-CoA hydratase/isomerase family protein n=1 Tax=Desulfogranum mediterraneum TaxID=160661 RepID=UPI00041F7E6F|nr:enoyl-CoA hydratase/isomerase family protein [Desulfogranum mediterraneum]
MTTTIQLEQREAVAVLRLTNGPTNALSPALVQEMRGAVATSRQQAGAMLLCGGEKFFSMGLDLPALLSLNREDMAQFWQSFNQLILDIYTLPLPTISVLEGHAVAGGNILALSCDYRLAGSAPKKIGLNEIKLGLPLPLLADLMLKQVVGERVAAHMSYSGEFMSFQEAEQVGLVDGVHPGEELFDRALEQAGTLAGLQAKAFAGVKANRTETIRARYSQQHQADDELFLDCWFSGPVQEILREAARNF